MLRRNGLWRSLLWRRLQQSESSGALTIKGATLMRVIVV